MINSLDKIFDGIVEMLRDQVLPKVDDEFTRGQLYAAMDLLANLKVRVDWDVAALRDDVGERLALLPRLAELLAGTGPVPPHFLAPPVDAPAEALEKARDAIDEYLCAVVDWVSDHRAEIPPERADAIDRAIRDQQRPRLKRSVKLIAPTLFGEMSRGR